MSCKSAAGGTMTETTKKEQHVDPWHAEAAEGEDTIDYDKLISKCGDLEAFYSYTYTYIALSTEPIIAGLHAHSYSYESFCYS